MTDCLQAQNNTPNSPHPSSAGLSVALVEALTVVHREQRDSSETPTAGIVFSNAEYRELGDVLVSMLSHSPPPSAAEGDPAAQQPLSPASSEMERSSSSAGSQEMVTVDPCSPAAAADKTSSPASSSESEEESPEHEYKKKAIKLPQRKGGMQLWQFLYALLSDTQYKDLIEWTSNVKEREFRLHEPETVAIWWGEHKNKRNMSYDKLSRSLRYYYDKGIIRKINGQRYVYRFCVDPEVMYRHIGNSDSRPRLKPMSLAARSALSSASKYHNVMCPQHMSPHPLPPTLFCVPSHYPAHSALYPTFSSPPSLVPTQTFYQTTCSTSAPEFGPYVPHPVGQGFAPDMPTFQPHLLSPIKHTTAFPAEFQPCYPLDEGGLPSLLSDGSPSPQPISPASLPPSFSSPLSPPPPYGWNLSLSPTL